MKKIVELKEKFERFIGERTTVKIAPKRIFNYYKKIETSQYAIYEPCRGGNKIVAAYGDMVLVQNHFNPNKLVLYPFYSTTLIHYRISLNKKTFPGLISGSRVLKCMLLPYLRIVDEDKYFKAIRMIIITDKAQIYHNFPARSAKCDGFSLPRDIIRFEESVIWDIPERKYPVNTPTASETERYFPNLPMECYKYHPILNDDLDFENVYGNGGFAKQTKVRHNGHDVTVSRFYIHNRKAEANPFYFIGMGEPEYKMSLMATYRSNVDEGVRICIFASTDGGRQWYCKYEFADYGEYEFAQGHSGLYGRNFGNPILNAQYAIENTEITVKKRELVIPSAAEKEPDKKFCWLNCGTVRTVEEDNILTLQMEEPHGLKTGNIIALCGDKKSTTNMGWMLNPNVTETSAGNGLLFKVEVIDAYRIKLYEMVSSTDNNIPCRHIHHINRIKDGWIIGTGEIYPNGWLLYFQMKAADTFTPVHAYDEFKIIRLNSTNLSTQRTMGAIFIYENVPKLVYASDHDLLEREVLYICSDRKDTYMPNSTGVFMCSLKEIDDSRSHQLIFAASEPCFYFQKLSHCYLFCGQRGELGISFNECKNWRCERIKNPIIHYYGNTGQRYYFDSCILIRK